MWEFAAVVSLFQTVLICFTRYVAELYDKQSYYQLQNTRLTESLLT